MSKRTKIIATIGPASSSPAVLTKLIHAGMDAARLNFSHGELKDHVNRIRLIRQASIRAGKPFAIIQDLQGPKLRVRGIEERTQVQTGEDSVVFTLTPKILKSVASQKES